MNKLFTILIILTVINAHAQIGNSGQNEPWNASWITAPEDL